MKIIALAFLLCTFINLNAQTMQYIKTKAEVRGIITESTNHQIHHQAVYDTYFKLVIGNVYKGQPPFANFNTDEKGRFYFELPIGVYSAVEQHSSENFTRKKNTLKEKWDNRCLRKKWQKPLITIKVKNMDPIEISFVNIPFDPNDPDCKKILVN